MSPLSHENRKCCSPISEIGKCFCPFSHETENSSQRRCSLKSEICNATISRILYLNRSIEQFGSGFKRIHSLCEDAGIGYSYENTKDGFKFVIARPRVQSDISDVTLNVTLNGSLNGTEIAVLAILGQKPDSSRDEIVERISKTVRTVQRALNSLGEKGYIERVGSKQNPMCGRF